MFIEVSDTLFAPVIEIPAPVILWIVPPEELLVPSPVTVKLPVCPVKTIPFAPPLADTDRNVSEPPAFVKLIAGIPEVEMLIPCVVSPVAPLADSVPDKVGVFAAEPLMVSGPSVNVAPAPASV